MTDAVLAIDALEAAIALEREALLSTNTDLLMQASQAKLDALTAIENVELGSEHGERVQALAQANRMNSSLLVRRRNEVRWALGYLGFNDNGTYGADGNKRLVAPSRYLGEG